MDDGNDFMTVDGPLTEASRRPAMQQGNPRPQTRHRTGDPAAQRALPINSGLNFPRNGLVVQRPAHTVTEDQRARNVIETYDGGQDMATAIFNSMQELRRNNPPAQIRPVANNPPPAREPFIAQAQAWKDLTSGFGGAQNIENVETRKRTMDVFDSIMSNIGNAAKNNNGNV